MPYVALAAWILSFCKNFRAHCSTIFFCRASMSPAFQRHAAFRVISSAEAASRMGKMRPTAHDHNSPQLPSRRGSSRRRRLEQSFIRKCQPAFDLGQIGPMMMEPRPQVVRTACAPRPKDNSCSSMRKSRCRQLLRPIASLPFNIKPLQCVRSSPVRSVSNSGSD